VGLPPGAVVGALLVDALLVVDAVSEKLSKAELPCAVDSVSYHYHYSMNSGQSLFHHHHYHYSMNSIMMHWPAIW